MNEYKIGEIIPFGEYSWRILDRKDDMALIITEYIIEHRSYHEEYKDITWAESVVWYIWW